MASRPRLPMAPLVIIVHIENVWVSFTSDSKEPVACYDEIVKEMPLAQQDILGLIEEEEQQIVAMLTDTLERIRSV